jgi:hypothetical protein
MWRLWAKSLGEKASDCDKEADNIAYIRTALVAAALITNIVIMAGVIHNW